MLIYGHLVCPSQDLTSLRSRDPLANSCKSRLGFAQYHGCLRLCHVALYLTLTCMRPCLLSSSPTPSGPASRAVHRSLVEQHRLELDIRGKPSICLLIFSSALPFNMSTSLTIESVLPSASLPPLASNLPQTASSWAPFAAVFASVAGLSLAFMGIALWRRHTANVSSCPKQNHAIANLVP